MMRNNIIAVMMMMVIMIVGSEASRKMKEIDYGAIEQDEFHRCCIKHDYESCKMFKEIANHYNRGCETVDRCRQQQHYRQRHIPFQFSHLTPAPAPAPAAN
ncbi:hypothetical protein CsatA_017562 [Cannabis sativa]